jgi:single-stranded-DNA-specific exonuclease
MERAWEILESDPGQVQDLARTLDIPELLARLLVNRDIGSPVQARSFLSPSLSDLHDPGLMKGMQAAVERLLAAVKIREQVCIYGDYDVDGVTSVSLLLLFFRHLGLQVGYYIPSRLVEGYGLNESSIDEIAAKGSKLLITVDCGISDVSQIRHARQAGMDVIVIDHHQVPDQLPEASAILNPLQPDCPFPAKNLAAVGVTFNLIMALRSRLRSAGWFTRREEPNLRELLDLVSLGTVADIVPLVDENRVITHFGLAELSSGRRPGVAALKEVSGMLSDKVAVGQVAFRLAPRINAVGRLGQASRAVELLTTRSFSSALTLARELDQANSERQSIEQRIYGQALTAAEEARAKGETQALVLYSQDWHVGVVGIVASRLVERFGCPAVLIAMDGEQGRGSARGTEHIHLYRAIETCADKLEGFGGHRAAAGLTIKSGNLEEFRKSFLQAVSQQESAAPAIKTLRIDAQAQPELFSHEMVEKLRLLAPHGLGNPEPLFMAKSLRVKSSRPVGREPPYHLKAVVDDGNNTWDVIGFGMGDRLDAVPDWIDLVYTPEFNTWEGYTSVQLRLRDFRPAES